jgi:ribosome-associated translation inhibitor RaiA
MIEGPVEEKRMNSPRIHWLGLARSEAIEAKVLQRAERLARFSPDIQRTDVWVEAVRGRHRKGFVYGVRLRLTIPGEEIAIDAQPLEENVYVSIRQSFDAGRRELEDAERRRRAGVKAHPRSRGDASRRRLIPAARERVR